ncbi:unnamed protein product [Urochloa decumbens]|uniref:Cysteine-rich receptor-like protein kinase 10 n=1 Tax=Urochloa decumbens TaxID=240449 RepID=A0ABC8XX84_9POAL
MAVAARHHRLSARLATGLLLAVASLLGPLVARRASAAAPFLPWQRCRNSGSYAANSTYQSNLSKLSAAVRTNASRDLFVSGSTGTAPDAVYALALCRGDANGSACGSCVDKAFQDARELCPSDMDAAVFEELCHIRYSDLNFLATMDNGEPINVMSPLNVTSPVAAFDAAVNILLNAVSDYAAANSSARFATAEERFDGSNPSIYGLAQCTPDMLPADCRSCLASLISMLPQAQPGRQGGRLSGLRCGIRYEVYHFFYGTTTLQLPAPNIAPTTPPVADVPAATSGGRTKNNTRIILAINLPIVAAVLLINIVILYLCWKRPARGHAPSNIAYPEDAESIDSLLFHISTLRAATDDFAECNRLGEGGFGAVYKGVLLDGQEIAVKRLSQSSEQGIQELKNELILVAKLQHKNLVRLVGVCLQEHEKLLVYEYMPNRSIDTILFDPEKRKDLDWERRFKLINGIARGLQYLHEDSQLKVIHRDLKASNVLLDSDYTPKISDFGLARLFGRDQSREVTNRVVGTYGYMAPEYAMRGHYSMKSDVFSFGVLILEILSGRSSSTSFSSEQSVSVDLLSLVWQHWTTGTVMEIMDSSVRANAPGDQLLKCVHIGLLCVQSNPDDRPMMSTVNVMLSSSIVSLRAPLKPVLFIQQSGDYSTMESESHRTASQSTGNNKSGAMSLNEVTITELEPR